MLALGCLIVALYQDFILDFGDFSFHLHDALHCLVPGLLFVFSCSLHVALRASTH